MAGRIINTTPKQDGFYMPGEFEPQERIWMLWPERPDNWRDGAKPAQQVYAGTRGGKYNAGDRFKPYRHGNG